jgi:hypothetical protein
MANPATLIVPQMPSRRCEKTPNHVKLIDLYKECKKEFYYQFLFLLLSFSAA